MDTSLAVKSTAVDTLKQFIIIKISDEKFGININYVDNIVKMQKITRVPKCQNYFIGVINLRGEIVPVMSLRLKFGLEVAEYTSASRIIIIKYEGAMVGLVVDEVNEVVTLSDDEIDKNNVSGPDQTFISAVGKKGEQLISILSLSSVILEKEQA